MLQKPQDRHNIGFAFEFNNKNIKKVFGPNLPPRPPDTIKLDLTPDIIRVNLQYQLYKNTDNIFSQPMQI